MRTLGLLIFVLGVSLEAQTLDLETTMPDTSVTPNAMKTEIPLSLPGQKVGPGDLIAVAVANCPELTRSFRVAADGTLPLPLLERRIHAAGKQPDQIGSEISSALVSEGIFVRPAVSAAVVEYESVPVSVLGAVKRPVTFQAVGTIKLLDALTRAEGLTSDAGPEILLTRTRNLQNGQPHVQHIPVKSLIDKADPSLNVQLLGGEEVRVPPAGRVYVVGNVKKSGTVVLTDGNDFTVLKAISLSEGLMPFTNKDAFIYRRTDDNTSKEEILIRLSKIIARKGPDITLKPNDILYIPDSKGRRITAQTLERIASFGSATATGILVWH
jgi:polysaccharide export outer membrane protein